MKTFKIRADGLVWITSKVTIYDEDEVREFLGYDADADVDDEDWESAAVAKAENEVGSTMRVAETTDMKAAYITDLSSKVAVEDIGWGDADVIEV